MQDEGFVHVEPETPVLSMMQLVEQKYQSLRQTKEPRGLCANGPQEVSPRARRAQIGSEELVDDRCTRAVTFEMREHAAQLRGGDLFHRGAR